MKGGCEETQMATENEEQVDRNQGDDKGGGMVLK
jgi:hypothetical protein